jgi:hypothetical protein
MQKVLADPSLDIHTTDVFEAPPGMNVNLNCDGSDDEIQGATVTHDDFF